MIGQHKSKDTKKLAIEYYKNNKLSYKEVASIFGMESGQDIDKVKKIVSNLIKKYPNFGGVFDWEYFNSDGDKNPNDWALLMFESMNQNKSLCTIS